MSGPPRDVGEWEEPLVPLRPPPPGATLSGSSKTMQGSLNVNQNNNLNYANNLDFLPLEAQKTASS